MREERWEEMQSEQDLFIWYQISSYIMIYHNKNRENSKGHGYE